MKEAHMKETPRNVGAHAKGKSSDYRHSWRRRMPGHWPSPALQQDHTRKCLKWSKYIGTRCRGAPRDKINLSCDPAIRCIDNCPRIPSTCCSIDICSALFTSMLFTVARKQQPSMPFSSWMDSTNVEFYSALKKWRSSMKWPEGDHSVLNKVTRLRNPKPQMATHMWSLAPVYNLV